MIDSTETGRPRVRVAQRVFMLVMGVVTAVNSAAVFRLMQAADAERVGAQLGDHAARLATLRQQLDTALSHQPAVVTPAEVEGLRRALDARLTAIEQAHHSVAQAADVQVLQLRLDRLEAQLAQAQRVPSRAQAARRPLVQAKAQAKTVPALPFRVVGLQQRAAERFVSVLPREATSLAEVRLLREGSEAGVWRLQSIETNAVVFRLGDQTQRVALPQE
ncbi:hypothetical protein [Chitinimonas lacunae]|uniref:Methyl-accepting chemotaxis protein n=1 Tax=Chitinimonas lacunae TaxID=1963018 RepID=A0ABV8MUE9_9NEIS